MIINPPIYQQTYNLMLDDLKRRWEGTTYAPKRTSLGNESNSSRHPIHATFKSRMQIGMEGVCSFERHRAEQKPQILKNTMRARFSCICLSAWTLHTHFLHRPPHVYDQNCSENIIGDDRGGGKPYRSYPTAFTRWWRRHQRRTRAHRRRRCHRWGAPAARPPSCTSPPVRRLLSSISSRMRGKASSAT
jgi:hypothetical protein